ncbi:MAG TPA: mevalonate kinase [Candidatus Nitrosotalea sp.]|nr:mevalonate kinase [Candidatus Nitrosotalea sp.]
MTSTASAPAKVILFGEHFVVYGVRALLCAIDKRITATSKTIDEKKIRIISEIGSVEVPLGSPESDHRTARFMRPFLYVTRRALKESGEKRGIEMKLESEIPPGMGLGSSSAACVAATASVTGLFGRKPAEEVLRRAIEAERIIFEDASGADSSVSALGGLVSYSKDRIEKMGSRNDLSLIIANSRQVHSTREEVLKVREFKRKNEKLFSQMCADESAIVEAALGALEKNDLREIGLLMSKNQKLLEKIGVSTPKLDALVGAASKTSYGSKITGAGGGGCTISLVDKTNTEQTLESLRKVGDCFVAKIDFEGLRYL